MPTPHESAQSLMQLYDLRREAKMREARHWVVWSFNPASLEDIAAAMQSEDYTYVRMATSYWDMAASFVVHGAIDPAMFHEVSGEMLVVFCKLEHMIEEVREHFGQPMLLKNVEAVAADWPGAKERMAGMREYFANASQS
ncbi:MAG: hypothetical protein L7S64_13320 [Longimicrobiales bacterium]|nr:hypothetical protein [Longimicrobiales bacterium]